MITPKSHTAALGILAIFALLILPAAKPQAKIGEIRMCAADVEVLSCPVDNPVFDKTTTKIYIDVKATELALGDKVRFTWYYLPANEYFSEYLGSKTEVLGTQNFSTSGSSILSTIPENIDILPGRYEVVIHPPNEAKPILKSFKVLD